ncbi:MAG: acyltransferase [Clostridia bacterium]|nr:acyltransferase [Clostridia bacterium]
MKKRMPWADALRGLLILMIVYGHTASNGDMLKYYAYSYHVAAFFFLSGFLFSKGEDGFKTFFKKKFRQLMIPYYIFSAISILVFALLGSFASEKLSVTIKHSEIYKNVLGMLYASAVEGYMKWNLPLWFLPCMFVSQLLYYPIAEPVKKLIRKKQLFVFPLLVLSLMLPYLDYFVFRVRALPFHIESSVFLMPFFLLGACIRHMNVDFCANNLKKWAVCILLLVLGALVALFFNTQVNYFLSSYGKITMFYLAAFLSVLGIFMLFQRISLSPLIYLGQNTMPILLMHKFPVVLFQILLSSVFTKTGAVHTLASGIIAVLSCALCLCAGRIIEKFAPFMLGKDKK